MEQQNHSSCSENNGALPLMGPLAAQSQANDVGTRRALIIDKRAVMGTEISRSLARRGYAVDVLGEVGSPAFYSRFCARRIVAPRWEASQRFLNLLHETVRTTKYDAIFVCNEEILESIIMSPDCARWPGLLLSSKPSLHSALSKFAMLQIANEAQVATPRTILCRNAGEARFGGRELGFPLILKGDRGESGQHVRLVRRPEDLAGAFREVRALEPGRHVALAIQEYVRGPGYSVGGLFYRGRPLRVCAHRKLIAIPPLGGLTVTGVTERCPGLLEEAFKIFAALDYTGLGHLELIKHPDGRFRFLEINPRIWGTIGVAEYAGVDLFGPYLDLARGLVSEPDLDFREGVRFHRIVREGRMIQSRPSRIPGLLKDMFDPRVRSDFEWLDPLPHLIALTMRRAASPCPAPRSDG